MAVGNRFFPAPRLILAALVAGVLAGAVAVYVSESGSGNNAPAQVAVGDSKDDVACAAKADRAKTVAAAATGQVAALLPADPPQSLKGLAFNSPDGKPMTFRDAVHSGLSVGVPGLVRMLQATHERSGKLPWAALFAPAIKLAEDGFPVSPRVCVLLHEPRPVEFAPAARRAPWVWPCSREVLDRHVLKAGIKPPSPPHLVEERVGERRFFLTVTACEKDYPHGPNSVGEELYFASFFI